jgi:hypothetical protein
MLEARSWRATPWAALDGPADFRSDVVAAGAGRSARNGTKNETDMTDRAPDPDMAASTQPYGLPFPPVAATAQPGWYPDPWDPGQHRFWDGQAWTPHAFPNGPAAPGFTVSSGPVIPDWATQAAPPRPFEAAAPEDADTPPPPIWSSPAHATDQFDTSTAPAPPPGPAGPRKSLRLPTGRALAVTIVLVAVVVGLVAGVTTYYGIGPSKSKATAAAPAPQQPTTPTSPGSTPATPADPAASALNGLVVAQADVAPSVTVQPIANGNQVSGEATLDVCNGTFPSEALRTARLQVAAADSQGNTTLSTEAVLYGSPANSAQAFAELKSVAANCPSTPVVSPVGEPTATTKFNPAPDSSWAQVPDVQRLAFDFVATDTTGQAQHSVAVYLRRGRALMGIYFPQPDGTQSAVRGQTTIEGISNIFATRMAQLPAATVS